MAGNGTESAMGGPRKQSPQSSVDAYQATLRARVTGPIAWVPLRTGGRAYVRQPTPAEHDAMLIAQDDAAARPIAFAQYVRGCFLGACDGDGRDLSFGELEALEGPAFIRGGALGHAVNKLAGSEERSITFL